jgi:hypothetical protein
MTPKLLVPGLAAALLMAGAAPVHAGEVMGASSSDSAFCKMFPKWCGKESEPGGTQNAPSMDKAGDSSSRSIGMPPGAPPPATAPMSASPSAKPPPAMTTPPPAPAR